MLRFTFAGALAAGVLALSVVGCAADQAATPIAKTDAKMMAQNTGTQMSSMFKGAKANSGYATVSHQDGKTVLTWSDDFKIPDTPAPHWQVVDSKGNTYLLQRLKIKDDKLNRTIVLPSYIHDVAKVQIWCSYAEALLGEASFASPVM